jgi:hypothetical protein
VASTTIAGHDLLEWLGACCTWLAQEPALHAWRVQFQDMATHATEPLRVAVSGDVSSGKSTLVNALLGRNDAVVDHRETTASATWYRDPSIPAPPALSADHRQRAMRFPLSAHATIVDTPGTNTASGSQAITEELLFQASGPTSGAVTLLVCLCLVNLSRDDLRRRIHQFVAHNRGPLDQGTNVVIIGAKADGIDTGGDDEYRQLAARLRTEAGRLGAPCLAVRQVLAASSRTGLVDQWLVECLRLIVEKPDLRAAIPYGWRTLGEVAAEQAPDLVGALGELARRTGTTYGLRVAAEVLARGSANPVDDIRRSWQRASGLDALESHLCQLDADVLTLWAVRGRLRHAWNIVGREAGAPIAQVLHLLHRAPAMPWFERRAAALVLASPGAADLPPIDREAAVRLLRGDGERLSESEIRVWETLAHHPGRSTATRLVAQQVLEVARES